MCECVKLLDVKLQVMGAELAKAIDLATGDYKPQVIVQTEKTGRKYKLGPAIFASFCPFCGLNYETGLPAVVGGGTDGA